MKIKKTIERNCCDPEDLKPVNAHIGKLKFCIYCGQLWRWEYEGVDASGNDSEYDWKKIDMSKLVT